MQFHCIILNRVTMVQMEKMVTLEVLDFRATPDRQGHPAHQETLDPRYEVGPCSACLTSYRDWLLGTSGGIGSVGPEGTEGREGE